MSFVVAGEGGTITVPATTLASVVVRAAERVDGVHVRRGRKHLDVEIADGRARAALGLVARYGEVLPLVARQVQEEVTDVLTTMCGVVVDTVDVEVQEIE
jgi:uncharacterized alkaline shock family protein YloU